MPRFTSTSVGVQVHEFATSLDHMATILVYASRGEMNAPLQSNYRWCPMVEFATSHSWSHHLRECLRGGRMNPRGLCGW